MDNNIKGLTEEEALINQNKYGKNILPKEKKKSIYKIFFSEFNNPIIILMLLTVIFSIITKEYIDAIAIVIIILLDSILGTIQEYKANKSAEALNNLIKAKSKVLRDNKKILINAEEITIDDIVFLESGDKVPADLIILENKNLTVDESFLTGESVNITKENNNLVYAGSSIVTGRAIAKVVKIGSNTEIGNIVNKVISTKKEKSSLTIKMEKFTKQVTLIVVVLAIIITVILLLKGFNPHEVFLSVVALSVSAMPEGLPLAITLALTIASSRMSKKNVIVKNLNSVESLGNCTVIASDKTGTLTVNEQTAKKIVLPNEITSIIEGSGYNDNGTISNNNIDEINKIIELGAINNESSLEKDKGKWKHYGDSIDIAFKALSLKNKSNLDKYIIEELIPYESEKKFSGCIYKVEEKRKITVKGSLETIVDFCTKMNLSGITVPIDKDILIKQNEELAKEGYRVIALAEKEYDDKNHYKDFIFLGVVAFIDPIRLEAKASINDCKKAKIKVLMITGDHPLTSFAIAKELGITDDICEVTTGNKIDEELKKGYNSFDSYIKKIKVFSRVNPIQKLEIVNALKRNNEFVLVTGDGVNDAPALKTSNIGISMGSGTDVARETSNMIIMDDNFSSIVTGIKEGRNAYSNIRKVIYLLLSCGIAEVIFFLLSIVSDLPIPLLAIQLLWLNIVTDGMQDIALSFEKEDEDIIKEKPRKIGENIFDKLLKQEVLISGISIGIFVFMLWIFLIKHIKMDEYLARGYIMAYMVFLQNIHMLNCRNEKKSLISKGFFDNKLIIFTFIGSFALQMLVMEVPLLSKLLKTSSIPLQHMLILILISLPILIVMEYYKKIRREVD
ncbi:MAG: HAD-IC family P-type ATPase [Bacilli bacterium]|nr:HAD-IC family P-type ATPase [Bacilli bacterium]